MAKLHKHLIVHAFVKNPPVKKDEAFVEQWLTDIVHAMDMEVLKEASAEYCEQIGNRGMTAGVYITTSHMILHTWDECEKPFIEFDIYTCSDLDPEMAFEALEAFGAYDISYKFLDRYNGLSELDSSDEKKTHFNDFLFDDDEPVIGRTFGDALVQITNDYSFYIFFLAFLLVLGLT